MNRIALLVAVIFSLSINAFADALRTLDIYVPADVPYSLGNPPLSKAEKAKDDIWKWFHLDSHSKIIFSLSKMKTTASANYYVKVHFCKQTIMTDCIASKFRSKDFVASDVGTTILDIKFLDFRESDWLELAKLAEVDALILKVQLMKVTGTFDLRPDQLQAQYNYDLDELMAAREMKATDPSIRFEMKIETRNLKD